MSIFKCKMCGGALEIKNNETVAICEYCGTQQTLPRLDDDKKANLYDRANHFRRNNDFDKAMSIYEQILNEDNTDAEAYWSLVLCRYGIEYVEDPATHKRIPTVNRAQFTSIYMDEDYKSALQYADGYQKTIYEEEAKAIDEIQKGILEISSKEEPFDVFICYKETDASGRRTQDSVLANDLYHQLTQEGFKVFFSRITLEDKLGTAYEPYIFAALNSSKVMVVLGTKPEYFNAVWVKNEWSRYLALIKQGQKKMLIPAYKDMDPYDLPEEFSHLQAQDMSKLGFMQDLIRGIGKILSKSNNMEISTNATQEGISANSREDFIDKDLLLKKAFLCVEDGKYHDASAMCDSVLNADPECATAYLCKLLIDLKICKIESLATANTEFDENLNYIRVMRYGDEELKKNLGEYCKKNKENNEKERLEKAYRKGNRLLSKSKTSIGLNRAKSEFEQIQGYKNTADLHDKCIKKIAKVKKRNRKIVLITIPSLFILICSCILLLLFVVPSMKYNAAMNKFNNGEYVEAISRFSSISGYKDSDEMVLKSKYLYALALNKEKNYDEAISILLDLEDYSNAKNEIANVKFNQAIDLYETQKFEDALVLFREISTEDRFSEKSKEYLYNIACIFIENGKKDDAISILSEIENFKDSAEKLKEIGGSQYDTMFAQKEYSEILSLYEKNDSLFMKSRLDKKGKVDANVVRTFIKLFYDNTSEFFERVDFSGNVFECDPDLYLAHEDVGGKLVLPAFLSMLPYELGKTFTLYADKTVAFDDESVSVKFSNADIDLLYKRFCQHGYDAYLGVVKNKDVQAVLDKIYGNNKFIWKGDSQEFLSIENGYSVYQTGFGGDYNHSVYSEVEDISIFNSFVCVKVNEKWSIYNDTYTSQKNIDITVYYLLSIVNENVYFASIKY